MTTAVHALSVHDDLCALVTALLPVVSAGEAEPEELRVRYAGVLSGLSLSADSDRDVSLLAGAVEIARWVSFSAELSGVDSESLWRNYLVRTTEI